MKQYIKLSIIVIFAVLWHSNAIKAANSLYASSDTPSECNILSHPPVTQQDFQNIYNYFHALFFCVEHAGDTQVPGNKNILLPISLFKMQQQAYAPECDRLLYLSPHPVPDANYYIFGLRKIII